MKATKVSITDINLESARQLSDALYMDDGLALTKRLADIPFPGGPVRMNFILMTLCTQGTATYSIDTHQQNVQPGDLMFISERHVVDHYEMSQNYECLSIMVSTKFYHDFVQNVRNVSSLLLFSMNNPVVHLTKAEEKTYSNYYQFIRDKMAVTNHPYRTELVKALLLSMFYDMSGVIYRIEQESLKIRSRASVFFSYFIRLLEENFRHERRVAWYAEQMGISPKYLSEVVKQVSKRTPTEWIDNYIVLELRVLLKNSTKSIKEITDELNFPNQSFLGKFFKDHVGMSPSEFRKNR